MKVVWQTIAIIIFIAALITVQIIYWLDPVTLKDIVTLRDNLLLLVNHYPISSAFIYTGLYITSILFGIPVSATILGGYLFGIVAGSSYSLIGVLCGSILLCSFSRYSMPQWIKKRYDDQLDEFNKEIKKYGMFYIIMIHALPFMPSFLPHIAAGLSSIALYKIIIANVIGALPLTILYAAAGAYLHELESLRDFAYYITIFGSILAGLFLLVMLYRYVKK